MTAEQNPELPLFGLRLTFECATPLPRLGFHGSWLRGVLGHALFRGVCPYEDPRCGQCALRESCPYPQVFKPHLLPGDERLPGYVLHDWNCRAGATRFTITLILIGQASRWAEIWIRHIHTHIPSLPLPREPGGRLTAVYDVGGNRRLFADGRFTPGGRLTPLTVAVPGESTLTLRFQTPLVSKHDLGRDPLLGPLRTRIQRMLNDYGNGGRLALDSPPWRVAAAQLQTAVIPRGVDNPRRVGGYLGWLRLMEITPEGAGLLALGRYVHAGGETSLGFGRYDWET